MENPDPVLSALFAYYRVNDDPPPSGRDVLRFRDFARRYHAKLISDPASCWMPLTFAVWWHTYVVFVATDPLFATRPWPADWPITPEELLTLREEYWQWYLTCGGQAAGHPDLWAARAAEAQENPERLAAFVGRRIAHLHALEQGRVLNMGNGAAECIGRPLELTLGTGTWSFEHPVYGTYTSERVATILERVRRRPD